MVKESTTHAIEQADQCPTSVALDTQTINIIYINEVFSHLETLGLGDLASWVKQIHMMPLAA